MGNSYLPLGIDTVVITTLIFTYAPPFRRCSATKASALGLALALQEWFAVLLVVEAEKFIIRSSGSLRKMVVATEAARGDL